VCREVWSAAEFVDPERFRVTHTSKVKVLRGPITFGGWKGQLSLDGDTMTVVGDEAGRSLVISLAEVKRASYNSNNGMWAFRLRDGRRLWIQSAGGLLSADRTAAGHETNRLITDRLAHHRVRVFGV
jgi:hypothetical protein